MPSADSPEFTNPADSAWSTVSGALAEAEVVLVNYRSRGHVEVLLDLWPADLRVVLVDNSGNADGIRELAAAGSRVRYVDGGGQGFARSANLGARSSSASYLLFVNPDSRPAAEQLEMLVAGLRDDPAAAAHAGTPADRSGRAEMGSGGWEPSVGRVFMYSSGLHKLLPHQGLYARPRADEKLHLDWVTGACMAVRREQFLALGGFDEAFYVYSEDVSFGRRVRRAGLRSVLRPDVLVLHGAGSSGAPSLEMLRLRGASFANYVVRYHQGPQATLMRAVYATGAFARAGLQLLQGNRKGARTNVAMAVGAVTRRAYVGGAEVARTRFVETSGAAAGEDAPRLSPNHS